MNHLGSSRKAVAVEELESRKLLSVTAPIRTALPVLLAGSGITSVPVNTATITGIPRAIQAEAGDDFRGLVGELAGVTDPTGLAATIDWGDGTAPTRGLIQPLPVATPVATLLGIAGEHTYAAEGTYDIHIIVFRGTGPTTPAVFVTQFDSTADIVPDDEGGVTLTEVAGQAFTAKIGSFDFTPTPIPVAATTTVYPYLVASIDWGDGTTSRGFIRRTSSDDYDVIGSHTYAQTGQFSVHVVVFSLFPPMPTATSAALPPAVKVADFMSTINVIDATPAPT